MHETLDCMNTQQWWSVVTENAGNFRPNNRPNNNNRHIYKAP